MPIVVEFESQRERKGLTVAQQADRVDITQANLFVLKSNRGRAIRFSTLEALCRELECLPGAIIRFVTEGQ